MKRRARVDSAGAAASHAGLAAAPSLVARSRTGAPRASAPCTASADIAALQQGAAMQEELAELPHRESNCVVHQGKTVATAARAVKTAGSRELMSLRTQPESLRTGHAQQRLGHDVEVGTVQQERLSLKQQLVTLQRESSVLRTAQQLRL